ncbi:MAG: GNAT family N-acetyltransferase [Marinobacter sp.]|uniref:GNAT family N-acetyltransferase n=1 Tax=Marinobacter sp. TaxID=50741 RepID=UPI00299E1AD4|nr:GNAT family N-acetyltransferase [Marinobacter sp.]MDX1756599.1 GNAT family N-acetyltransferase [Marinobacter sp.]
MTPKDYRYQVFDTLEDLVALRPDWDRLYSRIPEPAFYHDWRWYHSLFRFLITDISFVCLYWRQELIGVVPLTVGQRTRVLELPVCKYTDLADILLHPEHCNKQVLAVLLAGVRRHFGPWSSIVFHRIRPDSGAYALVRLRSGFTRIDVVRRNTFFKTRNEQDLTALSKKHLKNINRFERRLLKENGNLEYEYQNVSEDGIEAFLDIENSGWKGEAGTQSSILSEPLAAAFFRNVARAFTETGQLLLSFAQVNGRRISGQFGILAGDRHYLLKISYHPEYSDYSPGNLLLRSTLQKAAELATVDEVNLVTGPPWADRWHPETLTVYTVTLYSYSLRGLFEYGLLRLKDVIRLFRNKFQTGKAN